MPLILDRYSFRIKRLFGPSKVHVGAATIHVPSNWLVKKQGNSLWVFSTKNGELLFYAIIGEGRYVPAKIDSWKTLVESNHGYMVAFKIGDFSAYESASVNPNSSESSVVFRIQKEGFTVMVRYYGKVSEKYEILKQLIHSMKTGDTHPRTP